MTSAVKTSSVQSTSRVTSQADFRTSRSSLPSSRPSHPGNLSVTPSSVASLHSKSLKRNGASASTEQLWILAVIAATGFLCVYLRWWKRIFWGRESRNKQRVDIILVGALLSQVYADIYYLAVQNQCVAYHTFNVDKKTSSHGFVLSQTLTFHCCCRTHANYDRKSFYNICEDNIQLEEYWKWQFNDNTSNIRKRLMSVYKQSFDPYKWWPYDVIL